MPYNFTKIYLFLILFWLKNKALKRHPKFNLCLWIGAEIPEIISCKSFDYILEHYKDEKISFFCRKLTYFMCTKYRNMKDDPELRKLNREVMCSFELVNFSSKSKIGQIIRNKIHLDIKLCRRNLWQKFFNKG